MQWASMVSPRCATFSGDSLAWWTQAGLACFAELGGDQRDAVDVAHPGVEVIGMPTNGIIQAGLN